MRQFIIVPVANQNTHDWEAGIDGTGHRNMQSLAGWLQKEYNPRPALSQLVSPYVKVCRAHGGALLTYMEAKGWPRPVLVFDDRLAEFSLWQEKVDQMVRDYLVRVEQCGLVVIIIPEPMVPETLVRVGGTSYPMQGGDRRGAERIGYALRVDKDNRTLSWFDYRPFLLSGA